MQMRTQVYIVIILLIITVNFHVSAENAIKGIITYVHKNWATINLGYHDGVKTGMFFVVKNEKRFINIVKVRETYPESSKVKSLVDFGNLLPGYKVFLIELKYSPFRSARYYYEKGEKLLKKDELNKAFLNFYKGILVEPKNPISYINIAYCFYRAKEYKKAIKILNKALKLKNENRTYIVLAYNTMGFCFYELKEFGKSRKYFELSLKRRPFLKNNLSNTFIGLGMIFYKLRNFYTAKLLILKGIEENPDWVSAITDFVSSTSEFFKDFTVAVKNLKIAI